MAPGTAVYLANRAPLRDFGAWNPLRRGKWKIRTLLTACFAAIVLLMIVGDVIVVLQFERVETRAQHFYQTDQQSLAIIHVYLDVVTFRDTLTGLAQHQNPQEFASRATALRDNFLQDVAHAQQTLRSAPTARRDPTVLIGLETVSAALPSQVDTLLDLVKVGDWQAVRFRLAGQVTPLIGLSSSLVEDVEQQVAQERALALESVQQTRRQLYLVLPVTALMILLIAAILGGYATHRISKPLARLDAGAQALARGEFRHHVELRGNDELADLGRAFNYAALQLQKLYGDVKRSEAYLREGERLAHMGSFGFNGTGFTYWSDELFQVHGLDPGGEPPTIEEYLALVHPEDRVSLRQGIAKILNDHVAFDFTKRIVRPDGEIRRVHCVGVPVTQGGTFQGFLGTGIDVTEQQRLMEELRLSEYYLSEGQRLAHSGSCALNPSGFFEYWSPELFKIFGLDPQKGLPTLEQYLALVHPQDREFMGNAIKRMQAERSVCDVKMRIVRRDGALRHIRCVGIAVVEGEVLKRFLGTAIDITEQEQLTQELQRREAYLAEAQRLSKTGSWAWSPDTDVTYWSEECYRVLGFDTRDGLPRIEDLLQRIHPDDEPVFRESVDSAKQKKLGRVLDYRVVHPDGAVRYIHSIGHPVFSPSGELVEFVGTVMDVTERKQAEHEREKLRQLEADLAHINRVSILGEMAASLAHEIKQPIAAAITSANTCVEWLDHEPPNLDRARAAAARIDRYGNRAAAIIDRIRSLYKKSTSERELVDANQIIQEMLTLLKGEADRCSVAIRAELTTNLPKITADRVQLQQVFMNLMLNGIEAMEKSGGELTVRSQREDSQLRFSVSDTGVGLPTEKVDQIFSAFFTTKPQGSGMGLAISRSIVESHGGRLWATANDGRGATFHFVFPIEVTDPSAVAA